MLPTGEKPQHTDRIVGITWFAEDCVVDHNNSVGAQYAIFRPLSENCECLFAGETFRIRLWRFSIHWYFGDVRCLNGECDSRILQNFAATGRCGSQNEHDGRFYRKLSLDELNTITETGMNITTRGARERVIRNQFNHGMLQPHSEQRVVRTAQRRMGLLGRTEIRLHAKVDLYISAGEPASTALCEYGRLREF